MRELQLRKKWNLLLLMWGLFGIGFICCNEMEALAETTEDGYEYSVLDDGTIEITDYIGTATEIVIPDTIDGKIVTKIGDYAFFDCSLTNVKIPDGVINIGHHAFRDCTGLDDIIIPGSVTSIGMHAFCGCEGLTSVTIPESVTYIGDAAFELCTNLTNIDVESGNKVYNSNGDCNAIIETETGKLIQGCNTTTIPDGVTRIGVLAFSGCEGLTNITIPNTVTFIEDHVFNHCKGLTGITIPDSVTSIGQCIFYGCSGLTNIEVDSGNKVFNSNDDCNAIIETKTGKLIQGCNTTIIPSNVTTIGMRAFDGCEGLTDITIPNSVTWIEIAAFRSCKGLTGITIPNSVTRIEAGAFEGCSGLTSIVVESENKVYNSNGNCNAIIETETNTLIQGCNTTIIPSGVKHIEEDAFYSCDGLTSIALPDSVTSIGDGAFSFCKRLTDITIADSVINIGNDIFWSCSTTMIVYADADSIAAQYATEHGFTVKPISESPYEEAIEHKHSYNAEWTVDKEATCREAGSKSHHCTDNTCTEKTDITEIPKLEHSWDTGVITKPATSSAEGVKTYTCTACGDARTESVPRLEANTSNIESTTEQGKNKVEIPTVKKVSGLKITPKKTSLTVKWKKLSDVSGYQLQISTKSNFIGAKTINIKKSKTSYNVKKLKRKKKYYVRIRAYKTYTDGNGKKMKSCGKWAKVSKKTK